MIPIHAASDIGETLGLLRALARLTQRELAAESGISQTEIALYETGGRIPGPGKLLRLLAGLGHRLAIVPLVQGDPETAARSTLSDQGAEMHTRVGADHSGGSTGLSGGREDAWPNDVRCPAVNDWCPGNADGVLCARPCNPETDPEEQP